MIKTCYISKDRNHLTYNIKHALKGRCIQGKREVIVADRNMLESLKADFRTAGLKFSYNQSLYENIFRDIENGADGGSYLIDGMQLTSATGGYTIGGAEQATYRVPELRLDRSEFEDPEDVAAAAELMSDEVEKMRSDGNVGVGFWSSGGEVCFDVFNWVESYDEAVEIAFVERNEDAFYDLANGVEVFQEEALKFSAKDSDSFVNFKQYTSEYRNASKQDQLYMKQAWYKHKMFKGFI